MTRRTFVGKVMSLFNMLSRFVIAFLPRSKRLLISWLQSPSAVILELKKIKSVIVFHFLIKMMLPSKDFYEKNSIIGSLKGFPCGSAGKESACNVGDLGSIPGLGRSPAEGKGYPFQYSGLENSMDFIVKRVAKSGTRLSDLHITF